VTQAIEIEKELTTFEVRAKCRGKILLDSDEYNKQRAKLIHMICQINKVANSEGKGRDDLTLDILIAADGVMRKISHSKSKSLRHLAENIKKTFTSIRKLLQKYEDNIEIVDPQLKNNPELVDCLVAFETAWEKGKEYLLDPVKYSQLLFFSGMIEILCDKYKDIAEQLESRDPSVFVWVPSILILKSLDNEDKGICKVFNPHMFDPNNETTARLYIFLKNFKENFYSLITDQYYAYNLLERVVLFEDDVTVLQTTEKYIDKSIVNEFKKNLKTLSMQIQRVKPGDWNHFIDLAMNSE
jgi:hypothetical protein